MQADQPPFLPMARPPAIHALAAPQHGLIPLVVESHGYRYQVTGNTLLSDQHIQKILAQAADPQTAVGMLSATYRKEGYFLVAVTAKIEGKLIHIMVIQGQITDKNISSDLGWFYTGLNGEGLTESTIIRRNILAGAYSTRNGRQLQVSFAPAGNPGGSVLHVSTKPLPDYQVIGGNLLFGNYGSRYSSRFLAGASAYLRPGYGLELDANFSGGLPSLTSASQGSSYYQSSLGLSSITPWGTYGFTAGYTHYRIGKVAAPLYPTGNIYTYALTGSQLLFADTDTRIGINEGITRTANVVKVFDGTYTLTDQKYNYYTLGVSYSRSLHILGFNGANTFAVNYNQGISGRNGTLVSNVPGAPTPRFHYLTFNDSFTQNLPLGMTMQFTGSGQWSFDTLPQNQQWVVGGFGNLSAYYPGLLVGDSGYAGRLMFQSPGIQRYGITLTGSLFCETAGVTNSYLLPGQAPWQSLWDIGAGLNVSTRWGTTLSVISAIPVGHNNVSTSLRDSNRVDAYFILQQSF